MNRSRILIVEDEESLRTALKDNLELEGFVVETAVDGGKARSLLSRKSFDLVLLDWMLPVLNGPDLLRHLRGRGDLTPVLMLTVRNEVPDRVLGLELGADDFLGKPFALQELLARVHALLRRGRVAESQSDASPLFTLGGITVDLGAYRLRGKTEVPLSPKEAHILEALYRRRGQVVTRDQILDRVWGPGFYIGYRTIDTHILNLRKKLTKAGASADVLETVHGVGYRLAPDPEEP